MNTNYTLVSRLLPQDSPRRIDKMTPTYITIHETSLGTDTKDTKGGTMYGEKHYEEVLNNPNERNVAYHFLVEANYNEPSRVYQFLPTNVVCYHAGSPEGNYHSIGIERLVNSDTNMWRAIYVQARLSAELMKEYNIPLSHVVPHKFWSGKECPGRLLAGMYCGWNGFVEIVKKEYISMYGPDNLINT